MNLYSLTKDYTNQDITIPILEQDTGNAIAESKIRKGGGFTESDQMLAVEKEHIVYGDLNPKRILAVISGKDIHENPNACKNLLNEFCAREKQQDALSKYRKTDLVSTATALTK
jgi:hypothetical protein